MSTLTAPAVISPAQILTGGISEMQTRGRAFGTYNQSSGEVCVLGALAMAAGQDPDHWEVLQGRLPHWLEPGDAELLEAGRALAAVVRGGIDSKHLDAEELIATIGDWHDGTIDAEAEEYPSPPPNSQVYALVAEAAQRLLGEAEHAA